MNGHRPHSSPAGPWRSRMDMNAHARRRFLAIGAAAAASATPLLA
ncbi:hypothetical protein ACFXPY_34290 [Streptomyces sp. NPDC059153]